jgi:tetratricopeptide (TPR) repeat protein
MITTDTIAGAVLALLMIAAYGVRRALLRRTFPKSKELAYVEADMLLTVGIQAQQARDFDVARKKYERCRDLFAMHRDWLLLAKAYHQLGNIHVDQNLWRTARRFHKRSLSISLKHGFKQQEASSLYWLGTILLQSGSADSGYSYFKKSIDAAMEAIDKKDLANAYYGLGMACMKHLAFKEASAHLMNAIECEHLNHSEAGRVLHCMNALILCHLALRNLVEARKVLAEAERRYGRSSDPDVIAQLAQAKWMIKKGTEEAARQQ